MCTNRQFLVILTAALAFGISGCNSRVDSSKVLAKVNGQPLTTEDLSFRRDLGHGNKPQYGNKAIEDIIAQELLCQQGIRLGLDQDPACRSKLMRLERGPAGARRLELARHVFNTQIASKVEVSYQQGKDYYQRNEQRIATELRLQLVKFATRPQAEEALKKLRAGADFASIARPVMGAAAVAGKEPWELGFVRWDQVPVDFAEPLYRLAPGEISGVLGSQATGFQIVKLLAKRRVPKPGYQQVSAGVMNRLRDLKLLEAYDQYLETLKKEAKIVTF
jgi:peptidyl-prolyl cis-trans isomerase C